MTETPPASSNLTDEFSHFFEVRLDLFDGPIDLLLHLVKKNELPIEKVSLAEIANQYLLCLEQAKYLDLEIAGEYLVIAATLLSIKSSLLLNEPVEFVADEDGNLIDPHQELLERLRAAAIYRDGALQLGERKLLGVDVFANTLEFENIEPISGGFVDHDPYLLGRAFKRLLAQAGDKEPLYMVTVDSVSIVERMMAVVDALQKSGGRLIFQKLIPDLTSRGSIISTFLALLELAKRGAISIAQEKNFDEISIVLSGGASSDIPMSSEFDENTEEESVNVG